MCFHRHLSSKQVHYPEYVHACLCWCGSHCFTQDSARLPERRKKERKKEEDEDEQFAWATISVYHSVSRAKGLFKLRKLAWSFLDGWNFDKRRDSEDLQHQISVMFDINANNKITS